MKFSQFLALYKVGKSYDYANTGYKGQCVSLVKLYIRDVLGIVPQSMPNSRAKDYAKCYKTMPYLHQNFDIVDTPRVGDLFVRTSGTYGHIGIIKSINPLTTIEQNHNGCLKVTNEKLKLSSDYVLLRPKNRKNIDIYEEVQCKYIKPYNAEINTDTKVYCDNTMLDVIGSVVKGERVKLLSSGPNCAIIQYSVAELKYKTGIIPTKYIDKL